MVFILNAQTIKINQDFVKPAINKEKKMAQVFLPMVLFKIVQKQEMILEIQKENLQFVMLTLWKNLIFLSMMHKMLQML